MAKQLSTFFSITEILIAIISLSFGAYKEGALLIFGFSLFRFILKFSDGSFFLELMYLHATLTCLAMPYLGYTSFDKRNALAQLWVKYMPVPEEQYYGFMIPAAVAISLAFFMLRSNQPDDDTVITGFIKEIKRRIQQIPVHTIYILGVAGMVAHVIRPYVPDSLQQVNSFLYFSFYTSIFYAFYYTGFPGKKLFLGFAVLFVIKDALGSGMFTIIAYMGGIFLILIFAGKKISLARKLIFIVVGFSFICFIQLFKTSWRSALRKGNADISNVFSATVSKADGNQVETILFPIYLRMNQGFNIALVMRRIPARSDYLGGDYLALSFASAFVPRLLWPDKPKAGGQYNMKIYTGLSVRGWSTNVGPLGEAYGNFGALGGCLYMIAFGLFIRLCYMKFLSICKKQPMFFVWMPVLFYQIIYVTETDSLQAFNSLVKGTVFLFLIYKFLPALFPQKLSHETGSRVQEAKPAIL